MMGIASAPCRGGACALYLRPAASRTGTIPPVTPVSPADSIDRQTRTPLLRPNAFAPKLPELRQGADPVEMAVRGRIAYLDPSAQGERAERPEMPEMPGMPKKAEKNALPADSAQEADKSESAQESMEEEECQTCKNRKYQDGSDDPGVSFKTATRLSPERAASAVRGHEMEHVTREQAKAEREGRKVVQQSVTIHTAICPECGDVYVSGGTTRTVTAKDSAQEEQQQEQQSQQARQNLVGQVLDVFA